MIVLAAYYHGNPGQGDAIEAALKQMVPLVKEQEPGCTFAGQSRQLPAL